MSKVRLFPLLLIVAAAECWAQTATTTTLSLSSASAAWPTAVTLTATVKSGANPVTPGLVKFCNAAPTSCQGTALLGQGQLTASGTASIKLALPIGTHSINAVFAGTKTDATSTSSAETLTVTGVRSSSATLAASANSPYTLTTTVTGYGSATLSGNVSFLDRLNANYQVGTAALGTATTSSPVFQPQALSPTGSQPASLAIGDFNGDGYPDLVVGNVNANSSGVSTLTIFLSTLNGTFGTPITVNLPGAVNGVSALAVGDFNNDGKLDLQLRAEIPTK